jgi:hypothetical protein
LTKQELSQLFYLNREIAEEKRKLAELETSATNTTTKITGMPHVNSASRKSENMAILIAEQRDLISLKVKQSIIEYNRLNRYIADISDPLIRLILSYRYVNGFTWHQVAMHIGGKNTADSVRMAHDRFLENS